MENINFLKLAFAILCIAIGTGDILMEGTYILKDKGAVTWSDFGWIVFGLVLLTIGAGLCLTL